MSYLETITDDGRVVDEGPLKLNVVMVFEDVRTGLRAKGALDQTMLRLAVDTDVRVNVWKFELLREPALYEQAVNEAAEAEIVFVSAHGCAELPATVSCWLQQWLVRRGGEPCALVVSLDAEAMDTPTANQMLEALGTAARLSGVEVFQHLATAQAKSELTIEDIQPRTEMSASGVEEVLHRVEPPQYRDWGINE